LTYKWLGGGGWENGGCDPGGSRGRGESLTSSAAGRQRITCVGKREDPSCDPYRELTSKAAPSPEAQGATIR
jgi:hypothetical protein